MAEFLHWGPAAAAVPATVRGAVAQGFGRDLTGTVVKATPSGQVLQVVLANLPCHVKFYRYPTWRARWSGALRNTWLWPSRAAREWAALARLAAAGLQPDLRVAWGERRQFGFLDEAVLITASVPAPDLERWAIQAGPTRLAALEPALWAWVAALHHSGHRDRNLDPRNVLVVADGAQPRFVKIDSPRSFAVATGARDDRFTRADRARLLAGLTALRRSSPGSA